MVNSHSYLSFVICHLSFTKRIYHLSFSEAHLSFVIYHLSFSVAPRKVSKYCVMRSCR